LQEANPVDFNDLRLANSTLKEVLAWVKSAFGVTEETIVPDLRPRELVHAWTSVQNMYVCDLQPAQCACTTCSLHTGLACEHSRKLPCPLKTQATSHKAAMEPARVHRDIKEIWDLAPFFTPGHGFPGQGLSLSAYQQAICLLPGSCPCHSCLWQFMLRATHIRFLEQELATGQPHSGGYDIQMKLNELRHQDEQARSLWQARNCGHSWADLAEWQMLGQRHCPPASPRSPTPPMYSDEEAVEMAKFEERLAKSSTLQPEEEDEEEKPAKKRKLEKDEASRTEDRAKRPIFRLPLPGDKYSKSRSQAKSSSSMPAIPKTVPALAKPWVPQPTSFLAKPTVFKPIPTLAKSFASKPIPALAKSFVVKPAMPKVTMAWPPAMPRAAPSTEQADF
jgi:hypothetical protein